MVISDKHFTVVYTVNDKKAFEPELKRMLENNKRSEGEPLALTAWSRDHELHRVSLIEEALDAEDIELAREIISMCNIGDFETIDEIKKARIGA